MTKREARTMAKARRAAADLHAVGLAMAQQLFTLPEWTQADCILAFASMPDEPDTGAILARALADGKHLLLPRVLSKTEMDWTEITDLSQLVPGAYGILEAPHTLPAANPALAVQPLALIPCLAADRSGTRLGRGGGYYDRFLAHYTGKRLLLCPTVALLDNLPREEWDAVFTPQEILTEKGTLL